MPPTLCANLASAGAMMTANNTGVSSGTTSSRGVLALSASRRRASVANGASRPPVRGRATVSVGTVVGPGMVVVTVDMELLSRGQAVAGQPQVDVVKARAPGGDAVGGDAEVGDRLHGVARGAPMKGDGQRGPDAEGIGSGHAGAAQRVEGGRRVSEDPQLEQLPAEVSQQSLGGVEPHDAP